MKFKTTTVTLIAIGVLLLACSACRASTSYPSPTEKTKAETITPIPEETLVAERTPLPTANPSNDILTVDGVVKTPTIYKIEGDNFLQLRDVAMLLNGTAAQFSVNYDSSIGTVIITTGEPYTPQGWELDGPAINSAEFIPSNNEIYINGAKVDLTAFKINGSNFSQIRALGQALNFNVGWHKHFGVYIESDKPYTDTEPMPTSTLEPISTSKPVSTPEPVSTPVSDTTLTLDLSDSSTYRALNIFLSNFSECQFPSFSIDDPNYVELAYFAFFHAYLNNPSLIEDCDFVDSNGYPANYCLSSANIKNVVRRFISSSIDLDAVAAACEDGYYYGTITDDLYGYGFVLVDSITDLGENMFRAEFHVYSVPYAEYPTYDESSSSEVYSATPDNLPAPLHGDRPFESSPGSATFEVIQENNSFRFLLHTYTVQ